MKAYMVAGGLLLGIIGIACGSGDPILSCDFLQDCIDQGNSCPTGQELFCNLSAGGICDCAGGSGGTGGAGGSGGAGGAGGVGSCALGPDCNPFEIYDCDTPCRSFCGPGGTEVYGSCVGVPDPGAPPFKCVCHCSTEACP
ncbi:MAG: hypothetical protein WCF10_07865 [Polyangiales bacterium]